MEETERETRILLIASVNIRHMVMRNFWTAAPHYPFAFAFVLSRNRGVYLRTRNARGNFIVADWGSYVRESVISEDWRYVHIEPAQDEITIGTTARSEERRVSPEPEPRGMHGSFVDESGSRLSW